MSDKKLSNKENIDNYKKRKLLNELKIFFAGVTVTFAIVNLFDTSKIWTLLIAVLGLVGASVCMKMREKIPINISEEVDTSKVNKIKEKKKVKKKNTSHIIMMCYFYKKMLTNKDLIYIIIHVI